MPKIQLTPYEWAKKFDQLPPIAEEMRQREKIFTDLTAFYGFDVCTPALVEEVRSFSSLFKAGLLDERPPVICKTREGGEMMLRLSGTLSLLRAYGAHKIHAEGVSVKWCFGGESFFGGGTPPAAPFQMARERGVLIVGEEGPIAEAEIIQILWRAFGEMGIPTDAVELVVNAIGCAQCRPLFRSAFLPYLRSRSSRLCKGCKKLLRQQPTKILLCGEEKCRMVSRQAPQVLDFLCDSCKKHLRGFLEFLDEARIPYSLDAKLLREKSWFSTCAFVAVTGMRHLHEGDEEKIAPLSSLLSLLSYDQGRVILAEGGRMSRAAELLAGHPVEATGATVFMDVAHMMSGSIHALARMRPDVFLIQLGELAKRKSLPLIEVLRQGGITMQESLGRDSIKSQLKTAERAGAEIALVLGQKEALDETVMVREMESGIQETIPQSRVVDFLRRKLKK